MPGRLTWDTMKRGNCRSTPQHRLFIGSVEYGMHVAHTDGIATEATEYLSLFLGRSVIGGTCIGSMLFLGGIRTCYKVLG